MGGTVTVSFFGLTVLVGFVSAVLPIVNAETFVAVATRDQVPVLVALAATVGQMGGKLLWYYVGARADALPWLRGKLSKPRTAASIERWRRAVDARPVYTVLVLFVSASVGLPPYAVLSVVAGLLRVHLALFLLTGSAGRFLRFWAIAELGVRLGLWL